MLSDLSHNEIIDLGLVDSTEDFGFRSFQNVKGDNATGLILSHFNFNAAISSIVKTEYPFQQIHRDYFSRVRTDEEMQSAEYRQEREEYRALAESLPSDYGVCDYPQQLIEQFPILIADPRRFLVVFTPIRKEDQSEEGGWRWHKWGPYIGTQNAQMEYLADEVDIEEVYVYQLLELLPLAD